MVAHQAKESVPTGWRVLFDDMDTCPNVSEFINYLSQVVRLGDLQTNHPPVLRFGFGSNMFYVHVTGMHEIKGSAFNLHGMVTQADGPNPPIGKRRRIIIEGYSPLLKSTRRVLCRNR
jgi:hypothetical protein